MAEENGNNTDAETADRCGIVMPISGMPTHSAQHWSRVKTLLHRAVGVAGLEPLDVWTNAGVDRITTRIVENIYAVPIAICDISGLNANVMLETGMRLASKRPTIIVADDQVQIPFDIRDFEVVTYPRDTNIIEMELFLANLATMINERLAAFRAGTYKSFLGSVTIDVVEPQPREITLEQLFERRLDDIDRALLDLARNREAKSNRMPTPSSSQIEDVHTPQYLPYTISAPYKAYLGLQVPDELMSRVAAVPGVKNVASNADDTGAYFMMIMGRAPEREVVLNQLKTLFREYGLDPVMMMT